METTTESYNEAIEKLRKIVSEIESGNADIDTLSANVKEAERLITLCKKKLYKVDEDIKSILEELDNE